MSVPVRVSVLVLIFSTYFSREYARDLRGGGLTIANGNCRVAHGGTGRSWRRAAKDGKLTNHRISSWLSACVCAFVCESVFPFVPPGCMTGDISVKLITVNQY